MQEKPTHVSVAEQSESVPHVLSHTTYDEALSLKLPVQMLSQLAPD